MLNEVKHLIAISMEYTEMLHFVQHDRDFMAVCVCPALHFCVSSYVFVDSLMRYRASQPPSTTSTWPWT